MLRKFYLAGHIFHIRLVLWKHLWVNNLIHVHIFVDFCISISDNNEVYQDALFYICFHFSIFSLMYNLLLLFLELVHKRKPWRCRFFYTSILHHISLHGHKAYTVILAYEHMCMDLLDQLHFLVCIFAFQAYTFHSLSHILGPSLKI